MEELQAKQAEEIVDFFQRAVNRQKARKEREQAQASLSSVPSTHRKTEESVTEEPKLRFQNTLKKMTVEGMLKVQSDQQSSFQPEETVESPEP